MTRKGTNPMPMGVKPSPPPNPPRKGTGQVPPFRNPTVGAEQWPADRVERWPLDRLKPYAQNARTHSSEQIDEIAALIKRYGWTTPILATKAGRIIAGHGRVEAARRLGLDTVPVMCAEGWTEAQIRAYTLADNRVQLNAGWDPQILAVELDELRDLGVDLKTLGFSATELNDLIGTPNLGPPPEEQAPQMEFKVIVQCTGEAHQSEVYERLLALGLEVSRA